MSSGLIDHEVFLVEEHVEQGSSSVEISLTYPRPVLVFDLCYLDNLFDSA